VRGSRPEGGPYRRFAPARTGRSPPQANRQARAGRPPRDRSHRRAVRGSIAGMRSRRPGSRLALLPAVVALLAAVIAVVLPSAAAASAAGNGVGASHPVMILPVGPSRAVCADQGRREPGPRPWSVSGACVAAEDTGAAGRAAVPDPEPQFDANGDPNRGPAAWVNVEDEDGNVRTYSSSPGAHAEVNAQSEVPGGSMSRVWGWRGPTSNPIWREIPICVVCQGPFPPDLFPEGVQADPGGPWGL
jgi:hypothetical protein